MAEQSLPNSASIWVISQFQKLPLLYPATRAAHTSTTRAGAVCKCSWGLCTSLQSWGAQVAALVPRLHRQGRAELITPCHTFRSTEPFISCYHPFFNRFDFQKKKVRHHVKTSLWKHHRLTCTWLPSDYLTEVLHPIGSLLAICSPSNFSEFLISLKSSFLERKEEEARGESGILGYHRAIVKKEDKLILGQPLKKTKIHVLWSNFVENTPFWDAL